MEIKLWYRALARFCDYCLCFLGLGAISLFLPYFYGPFFYYFLALFVPIIWVPIEAFCLMRWAATPGKVLCGISVRTTAGKHLSYKAALRRALFVLSNRAFAVHFKRISWKRKLFAFAASSAFVLAAVYGHVLSMWSVGLGQGVPSEGWVQYSSSDVGFKVSFPNDPEQESKELVIPQTGKVLNYNEITSAGSKKVSYSLSHMKLPSKWRLAGNTTLLKGVLEAIVKYSPDTELLEKQFTVHQGYRALDFRMKQGESEVKGRLIIVGGTLYKLAIDYPPSHSTSMQENPFINSFEITS